MQSELVEDFRERFRDAPYGVWSTCATAPADQTIRFFNDRRGVCHIAKRLGGGVIHFEWQPHEECCLRIRRIDPRTALPKGSDEWLFLRYEFDHVSLRDGDAVVMRMLEFGRLNNFAEPLYFHGQAVPHADELIDEEPGPRPESVAEQLHGRLLIAVFITGMIVGIGLFAAGEMQADVHPLVYLFGGIGLFFFLYFLMSRPARRKPAPEDEYIREQE
jgi:hypothetical protein